MSMQCKFLIEWFSYIIAAMYSKWKYVSQTVSLIALVLFLTFPSIFQYKLYFVGVLAIDLLHMMSKRSIWGTTLKFNKNTMVYNQLSSTYKCKGSITS